MKRHVIFTGPILLFAFILTLDPVVAQGKGREVQNFNYNWKFYRGDIKDGQKPGLDETGWRDLDLPHDWSIEGPFSKDNSSCTGYLPGGIGWYRKEFTVPKSQKGQKVFISFDGVYNNSEVWINGTLLARRPNGYISFQYDLTPLLNYDRKNLIAVKVDHTLDADSRWYTGSGIYRNVKLITTDRIHVKQWGVYYTTPEVSPGKGVLSVNSTIVNDAVKTQIIVTNTLWYGSKIAGKATKKIILPAGTEATVNQVINIDKPEIWDVDDPKLYRLVTEVKG